MSEYQFVEKPFLDQLASMGWDVHDLGPGIPTDPATSFRSSFREVVLTDIFKKSIKRINTTEEGREWLSESQLDLLLSDVTDFGTSKLLAANEEFQKRLYKWQLDTNELTGESDPVVKLIDFENWHLNTFTAINQFRVDTPGHSKGHIRPDIALFVNGLPLVVVECKELSAYCTEPMSEGIDQLLRYADLREPEQSKHREGEQSLFFTNQLLISTYGDDCKFGSITSSEDYFFNWKTIYPDKVPYIDPFTKLQRSQEELVQGMLHPERLLDITRNFTLFMDAGGNQIKVICRYQQFRAVQKIIQRMKDGQTGLQRSGVVWHTQGSGKSLTMVFLVRKLRRDKYLKRFKVLMVNDRTDLEEQLTKTAALTGETVREISSAKEAKDKLASDFGDLNMVMIHKFREQDAAFLPESVRKALSVKHAAAKASGDEELIADVEADYQAEIVFYKPLDKINTAEEVLILVDEAHRTQRGGKNRASLSDNLFDAFPNATRVAFSGTPLIAEHHTDPTWKRFGINQESAYIDKYKLQDAVDDGATLQIIYEGKTADSAIYDKSGFDTKFEDLFANRTEEELLAIRKKYGAEGDVLEAEARIEAIAEDMVKHYVRNILSSSFKAQVVCSSKQACIYYQTYIDKALEARIEEESTKDKPDDALLKKLRFIKTAVVMSSDGTNEKADFVFARKASKELNAVESFKAKFDYSKPETGVTFLIVCDMLLTGFDAPIEQVMYLDKKLREHNLLQTIARVNRTYKEKKRGYIVDYIGLTNHLKEALSMYSGEDLEDMLDSLRNIDSEVPVLESRYQRLLQLFQDEGIHQIEELVNQRLNKEDHYQVQLQAIDVLEGVRQRDSFNVYLKKFLQSMDIIMPNPLASPFKLPMYQFVHLQAKAKERYKDDSMNLKGVGEKIRQLVNEHLIHLGINPQVQPVELFSDAFMQHMGKESDLRAQASEMEHAIRKHCKVNGDDDPVFYKSMSEKMEEIIKKHGDNWKAMLLDLGELREHMIAGRGPDAAVEDPFYDLVVDLAFGTSAAGQYANAVRKTIENILDDLSENIGNLDFWERDNLVSELRGKVKRRLMLSRVPELKAQREYLATEIVALAKRREKALLGERSKSGEVERLFKLLKSIDIRSLHPSKEVEQVQMMLKHQVNGVDVYLAQELELYPFFHELMNIRVTTDINLVPEPDLVSSFPYEVREQFNLFSQEVQEALLDILDALKSELAFDEQTKPIIALKDTEQGSFIFTVVVYIGDAVMTKLIGDYSVAKLEKWFKKSSRVEDSLPALVEQGRARRGINKPNYGISRVEERNMVEDALLQMKNRNQ
jgi:type I restriction enzyme R subunit